MIVIVGLGARSGEEWVADRLSELPRERFVVLNDVMLPTRDGITTQVDHVVLGTTGIFVVETKDYSGWIFGDEKARQWTQSFRSGKYKFQNLIRQNWRHIYVMADLLDLPTRYFRNVVAFVGEAEIMTQVPDYVVSGGNLCRHILSFDRQVMSRDMVEKTVKAIRAWESTVTEARRAEHVANLHSHHDAVELSVLFEQGELKCPRCGAKMVLRHRRSDQAPFYGCSNYPDCRGTLNARR
ncbi:MAG: NERD domain-containing protein [Kiritimatiellia bacterium]